MKMSVHVDDPPVIDPEGPIRTLFEWLGQRIAVKGLETLDSERGLKYLGMLCYTIPGGYLETTPSGYIEGKASMMGVTHAKNAHDTRNPTKANRRRQKRKLWMRQDNECLCHCGQGIIDSQSST